MPHLVQMQNKYAGQGFVGVTVSLDEDADKPETQKKVAQALEKKKITVTNFILDAPVEEWQAKLSFEAVPCVYVFNREGKWVKKFKDDVDYDEIEKLVVELLKK